MSRSQSNRWRSGAIPLVTPPALTRIPFRFNSRRQPWFWCLFQLVCWGGPFQINYPEGALVSSMARTGFCVLRGQGYAPFEHQSRSERRGSSRWRWGLAPQTTNSHPCFGRPCACNLCQSPIMYLVNFGFAFELCANQGFRQILGHILVDLAQTLSRKPFFSWKAQPETRRLRMSQKVKGGGGTVHHSTRCTCCFQECAGRVVQWHQFVFLSFVGFPCSTHFLLKP